MAGRATTVVGDLYLEKKFVGFVFGDISIFCGFSLAAGNGGFVLGEEICVLWKMKMVVGLDGVDKDGGFVSVTLEFFSLL